MLIRLGVLASRQSCSGGVEGEEGGGHSRGSGQGLGPWPLHQFYASGL